MAKSTRSIVFSNYNRLSAIAKRFPAVVDLDRLNRALSIAQSPDAAAEDTALYDPCQQTCTCGDYTYRESARRKSADGQHYTGPCKHQLHHMLVESQVSVER